MRYYEIFGLKSIDEVIDEALQPSQYRKYMKIWDPSKYESIFRQHSGHPYFADKKYYRIYIPLFNTKRNIEPPAGL